MVVHTVGIDRMVGVEQRTQSSMHLFIGLVLVPRNLVGHRPIENGVRNNLLDILLFRRHHKLQPVGILVGSTGTHQQCHGYRVLHLLVLVVRDLGLIHPERIHCGHHLVVRHSEQVRLRILALHETTLADK